MSTYSDLILFSALIAVIAFSVTALLGFVLIPWLRKLKIGQTILDIGPSWHKSKEGIPTMGGIMFVAGSVIAIIIFVVLASAFQSGGFLQNLSGILRKNAELFIGILMALLFGLVGFLDDYIKVVKKRNKGLGVRQKTVLQVLIISGYLVALWFIKNGAVQMWVPFAGMVTMPAWAFFPFGFGVLYAATNAVNFTDGIDGLCSSVTATAAAAFTVLAIAVSRMSFVASSALLGACLGFYCWNRKPAKVFMGDTGSMFLGGMVVALAYALNAPIILLFFGLIYVIEGLSDVLQIGYFKLTHGKRIFKMAPIHHHFEMSGWSEKKIVAVFCAVNLIGVAAGFLLLKYCGYDF
ncbi:MAG: phospho-N-acetylmuramoyl-pentapeptide-transferase [Clostridium sp.]|jgi:phospho-N-acetylmuramoyl-pentapeptide-transferase|nr:phospho-N-acetylmuramoyl-pentapeptide-transferase [Clostridium sp.]